MSTKEYMSLLVSKIKRVHVYAQAQFVGCGLPGLLGAARRQQLLCLSRGGWSPGKRLNTTLSIL